MEEVPAAIAPFQGRVLIGVGKLLRVYDLGKKKLLRKCENKVNSLYRASELASEEGGNIGGIVDSYLKSYVFLGSCRSSIPALELGLCDLRRTKVRSVS